MAYEVINLGLSITIPTTGQIQYGPTLKNSCWKKISQHKHEGGGDGNPIQSAGIAAESITSAKLSKNIALKQASILAPTGTTQTIDFDLGNMQILDLSSASGNVTVALSNPQAGAMYRIKIIQGVTARTIIWPGSVLFPGGVNPTLHQNISSVNVMYLDYDGSNYLGSLWENDLS